MPNRILRDDILTCPRLNSLPFEMSAESLWYRLFVVADDFGRFNAHAAIVASDCYPLQFPPSTKIPEFIAFIERVESRIQALARVGLIFLYEVENKRFGVMWEWRQKRTSRSSKFPAPPVDVAIAANVDDEPDWKAIKSIKAGSLRRQALMRIARSFNGALTSRQERAIVMLADKCALCPSTKDLTLDHVVPISKGGRHVFDNVQVLCRICNCSKSDRMVD